MKTKIFIIILLICVMGIIAYIICDETSKTGKINDITMIIKKNTLTNKEATVIIQDNTGVGTYIYGESFKIEKKIDDKWNEVKKINNAAFNYKAYYVDRNGMLEMNCEWEYIYGELAPGEYRIVKDAMRNDKYQSTNKTVVHYLYAEFILE